MDEMFCSFCGIEIGDKNLVYGITKGSIDESCYGFRVDCPNCMDTIDKLIADYKRTRQ
jgi:hypothetical protein